MDPKVDMKGRHQVRWACPCLQVSGVLNGIDLEEWDPALDAALPANFSASQPEGRALCKRYLQRGLGLAEDPSKPLVAVISRLVPQKGVHLIQVGGRMLAGWLAAWL
jgi:glycogen synthase